MLNSPNTSHVWDHFGTKAQTHPYLGTNLGLVLNTSHPWDVFGMNVKDSWDVSGYNLGVGTCLGLDGNVLGILVFLYGRRVKNNL